MFPCRLSGIVWRGTARVVLAAGLIGLFPQFTQVAFSHEVKDLKYGAVLFEFHQKKYFETLVEYDYAAERGGILNHGDYPELLKGGVSLSYGLDRQARDIFSRFIAEHSPEQVQNRAWFFLAKMLYLRGDSAASASMLSRISGSMPVDIDQEYRYLAALVNIRLGYFDAAEAISETFDRRGIYAPYLYFNMGVALGKQKQYGRAIDMLEKAAAYRDGSSELESLADRAHMAIAYLNADRNEFDAAQDDIARVRASGAYSNRALLSSGWVAVNHGAYQEALAPLTALESRSLVVPEVQEAVLLVPHVYEKLGLLGRAAEGFIRANVRYGVALEKLEKARRTLDDADVLELFVRNLDEMLGDSDWFGTAPSVSLNALSPFLIDMMADHSFQSVLKDLRDLYAIRNNLENWKSKSDDFDVIIAARSLVLDREMRSKALAAYREDSRRLREQYDDLEGRVALLGPDERDRVQWLLEDVGLRLESGSVMEAQLSGAQGVNESTDSYAGRISRNMELLDQELGKTAELIAKVENVLLDLVRAELDRHEQRIRYYKVQSQLAKARILDRSLTQSDTVEPQDEGARQDPPRPADVRGAGSSPGQGDENDAV